MRWGGFTLALVLLFSLALIAPSSSKVLAQDTPARSQQATPTSQPTRIQRATPTSQPTRTQKATPTSDSPKESIAIFVEEKVLLNEVLTETTGRQRENARAVEDEINPLPLSKQSITIKEKLEIFVDEDEPRAVEDETNPLPLSNQLITVKEKLEIFVDEDEASAKTKAVNDVESDCAIQSGGRSSFSAFGLLLTPLLLHIWRRTRNA